MPRILSLPEFEGAFRSFPGMTEELIKSNAAYYSGARRAAESVLPQLPTAGFFTGRKKCVLIFMNACILLDDMVEAGSITQQEAQLGLFLMAFSDDSFQRVLKIFTQDTFHLRNKVGPMSSKTANYYINSMA